MLLYMCTFIFYHLYHFYHYHRKKNTTSPGSLNNFKTTPRYNEAATQKAAYGSMQCVHPNPNSHRLSRAAPLDAAPGVLSVDVSSPQARSGALTASGDGVYDGCGGAGAHFVHLFRVGFCSNDVNDGSYCDG
jgi:hypothetical protein